MSEILRTTPGSKADLARRMSERRRSLIARPISEIWEELAEVAMSGWQPIEDVRQSAIEECAKIADERAAKLRAKAKAITMPSRQSYFAQAIEARAIADLIRALPAPPVHANHGAGR